MTGLKYYERMTLLIELIDKRNTGIPKGLASKFGVTERTVYNFLDSLLCTFPKGIVYSAEEKSYVFLEKSLPLKFSFSGSCLNYIVFVLCFI